jgi:RecB family endonuclease NucS
VRIIAFNHETADCRNKMDRVPSKRVRTMTRITHYEKELKVILRQRLCQIEDGLVEADGGHERAVATGKIDITAKDKDGNFVVIELKAGPCPVGTIEQVLGYASDLETETGMRCRAVIVASEFSERIRAATKRTHDLRLINYVLNGVGLEQAPLQPDKRPIHRAEHHREPLL